MVGSPAQHYKNSRSFALTLQPSLNPDRILGERIKNEEFLFSIKV